MQITIMETTLGDMEKAKTIAVTLVEEKLIACAQIQKIHSVYFWNNEIQNDSEFRILMKTQKNNLSMTLDRIKELHPYDLPEILHYSVNASDEYAEWCRNSTQRS